MKAEDGSQVSINVRGVDQELWRWLKASAALEGKAVGKKLNEVLAELKCNSKKS